MKGFVLTYSAIVLGIFAILDVSFEKSTTSVGKANETRANAKKPKEQNKPKTLRIGANNTNPSLNVTEAPKTFSNHTEAYANVTTPINGSLSSTSTLPTCIMPSPSVSTLAPPTVSTKAPFSCFACHSLITAECKNFAKLKALPNNFEFITACDESSIGIRQGCLKAQFNVKSSGYTYVTQRGCIRVPKNATCQLMSSYLSKFTAKLTTCEVCYEPLCNSSLRNPRFYHGSGLVSLVFTEFILRVSL